jgi:hypothetical protein
MMYGCLSSRVVAVYTLYGQVDAGLLAKAFQAALAPHATLRARVVRDGERYRLCPEQGHSAPRLRIQAGSDEAFHHEVNTPLEPGGDLVRAVLLRGPGREHTLLLQLSHAFSDGRSVIALGNALWRNYSALVEGKAVHTAQVTSFPDPIETRLGHWTDSEVSDFVAAQAKASALHLPATLPATGADRPEPGTTRCDAGRPPRVEVQRLLLDRGDTEGVLAAAKENGLAVHGLISGVLLSGLRPHLRPANGPVQVGCMSAVDLRSRLDPPVPETDMIVGASWFTGVIELTEERDPVEIGRDYLNRLREGIARAEPELNLRAIPHLTGGVGVLKASLSVSNLQAVSLPPTPPGLVLTDLRMFGAPDRDYEKPRDGRLRVTVLTVNGRLSLDIAYDSGFFRPSQIREFLDTTAAELRSYCADIENHPMPRAEGSAVDRLRKCADVRRNVR